MVLLMILKGGEESIAMLQCITGAGIPSWLGQLLSPLSLTNCVTICTFLWSELSFLL